MDGTMRIAICERPHHIVIQTRSIPSADAGEVLVEVALCGVCGSDLAVWQGSGHKRYPYSPGHEFCGTVEHVGQDVTDFRVGQRVVVDPNLGCGECDYCRIGRPNLCDRLKTRHVKSNGGLSEYVALDARMVHLLPEVIPDELAPFIEPLSCALHAARRAQVGQGERVAIFGAGIIGMLTGLALQSQDCELLFVEPVQERHEQIVELFHVPPMTPRQFADSHWVDTVDVAIDCSGNERAVSQAIAVLRKGGRLLLVGLVQAGSTENQPSRDCLPLMQVTTKELEIKGVWLNPHTFGEAIRLAEARQDVLSQLTTELWYLDDIAAAFERASSHHVNKVLVKP